MDILRFEKRMRKYWGGTAACAQVIINGDEFIGLVREHELPSARKCDEESIAGGYEYEMAEYMYRKLTRIREGDDDEISLLVCGGCLDEGCWPLYMRVEEAGNAVIWKDFDNPHRSDTWDYRDFGPFFFDREQYWFAVEELKGFWGA